MPPRPVSPRQGQMPTVGEEVLLINHFGSFLVEEVDVEAKTAALRRLDSDALIKDMEWSTIWPLDDKTRKVIAGLKSEATIELLRKILTNVTNGNSSLPCPTAEWLLR